MQAEAIPILFNALKHHRAYLQELIKNTPAGISPQALRRLLLPIGAAQLDFYTGPLHVADITTEVKMQLTAAGLHTPTLYQHWLSTGHGYQRITLPDRSVWVLREGLQAGYWVHLHPARYAPYTLRLKANTLKTATALLIRNAGAALIRPPKLATVNSVRTALQLPPLAARHLQQGLWQTMRLLF